MRRVSRGVGRVWRREGEGGALPGLLKAVARACQATCENNEQTCLAQSSSAGSKVVRGGTEKGVGHTNKNIIEVCVCVCVQSSEKNALEIPGKSFSKRASSASE